MDSLSFSQIQGHFDEPPAPNNTQYTNASTDKVRFYEHWRDVLAHFEAQPWTGPPLEAATHTNASPIRSASTNTVRDVLFTQGTRMWGVEVKSVVSREGDILRGLFQCVKYHALLQTEQAAASNACFVDVYLACEHEFPAKLLGVAHVLGVEVFDRPGMGARQRSTT